MTEENTGSVENLVKALRSSSGVKPGVLSSEFWLNLVLIVVVAVLMLFNKVSVADLENLWPLLIGPGAYALSRSQVKSSVRE